MHICRDETKVTNSESFSLELHQIFRDDGHRYEDYMWKFSEHKYD